MKHIIERYLDGEADYLELYGWTMNVGAFTKRGEMSEDDELGRKASVIVHEFEEGCIHDLELENELRSLLTTHPAEQGAEGDDL